MEKQLLRVIMVLVSWISFLIISPYDGFAADNLEGKQKVIISLNNTEDFPVELLDQEHEHLESIGVVTAELTQQEIENLTESNRVQSIQPDVIVKIKAQTVSAGYKSMKIEQIRKWGLTGKKVKVAIIDTGVSVSHPDIHVKEGKSFVSYSTSFNDDNGHGTHVAGIVSAIDNEIGTLGMAPNAELYAVKVLDQSGEGYLSDILAGIDWAINKNVDIINLSLGTLSNVKAFEDILNQAYQKGIIIIAAAGNDGTAGSGSSNVSYPAKYNSVMAVSSINNNNQISSFSSSGKEVELTAPGEGIFSTYTGQSYSHLSGTSMAAGYVTGLAALIKEAYPNAGIEELRQYFHLYSSDLGIKGRDPLFGFGVPGFHRPYFSAINGTNVYAEPDSSGEVIGFLQENQVYPFIDNNNGFKKISMGNRLGYVKNENAKLPAVVPPVNITQLPVQGNTYFYTNRTVPIYENRAGKLSQFGKIPQDMNYHYMNATADLYTVNFAGRQGFVKKIDVEGRQDYEGINHFKVGEKNITVYLSNNGILKPVGVLESGQEFARIKNYGDWHQIQFGDKMAYVWKAATQPIDSSLQFSTIIPTRKFTSLESLTVYDNGTGKLVPIGYISANVDYPYISDYGDWLKINFMGRNAFIFKPAVRLNFQASDQFYKVDHSNVTVYERINKSLVAAGKLMKGQTFIRVKDYGDWHEVKIGSKTAYIWEAATSPASKNESLRYTEYGSKEFIANKPLTVYDNSNGVLTPIAIINEGTRYSFVQVYGDWYKINYSGRSGYVYKPATRAILY